MRKLLFFAVLDLPSKIHLAGALGIDLTDHPSTHAPHRQCHVEESRAAALRTQVEALRAENMALRAESVALKTQCKSEADLATGHFPSSDCNSPSSVVVGNRVEVALSVSTVAELESALRRSSESVVIAPGHYRLRSELVISRSVALKAQATGTVVLDGLRANRVLDILVPAGGKVELSGLIITGGQGIMGGGIFINPAQPGLSGVVVLEHCEVHDNAAYQGAGISISGSNASFVTLKATHVHNNSAFSGGGILVGGGVVTLEDCSVHHNSALGHGGGLSVSAGTTLAVHTSAVYANTAHQGEELYIDGGGAALYPTRTEFFKLTV
eukprot:CAMPEP_0183342754 /NCGR_PEP_ID=MMETSP0164_2-20130417/8812_1 /TAXON_ID=221442 /ORGANISM="Coccolithus pelagicus ssp braarudi, Strain PLY182g" /LENGTH=325 /DNA_ID=CAMNT_0025513443 /DNA_START=11 /DNA_END=988 /DNA_ORIENTATION=-